MSNAKQVKLRKMETLKRLQELPGIGPSLADDLFGLGYRAPEDLQGANPVEMFVRLEEQTGSTQDPCVFDAFQCAVYCASTEDPEPLLSQWWTRFRRVRRNRNRRRKTAL
jgi:hypothetical protein